jgi:DivIVA domain-containing protein
VRFPAAARLLGWDHLLMDQDDPEKRIADLERQLAEARAARDFGANRGSQQGAFTPPPQAGFPPPPTGRSALTTGGGLTPEQVRNVAFSKPPIGGRGYNEDEVDAFLDRVEAALQDPTGHTLTPDQVGNVAFSKPPLGKRGYNQAEVDAFLDCVEQQIGRPPQFFDTQMAAGPPSVVYPGQGSPPYFGAAAGVGPLMEGHMTEHPPSRHPPPAGGCPAPWTMKIRPNLFLFWTPRWRDWRTSGGGANTSSDSNSGNLLFDLIWGFVFDFLFNFLFDILWNWFLWVVWAAIVWVLEVCVAVVLAPVALLTSVLGVPRHRLVAVSEDGGAQHLLNRGSWYAVRRARAEARARLAREPNAAAHP